MSNSSDKKYVVRFCDVGKEDIGLVGGKGANMGEMALFKIPMPDGFIITSEAYARFLKENTLEAEIEKRLRTVDIHDPKQLASISQEIKRLINTSKVPLGLAKSFIQNYEALGGALKRHFLVAVRSSATAEDLPDASFAGQQETFLNVKGEANLVNRIRACWASLFTPRAIFYREEKKFSHFLVRIAVIVQKMVQADTSGVMFTIDPINKDKTKIIIEAIYGLGELIVQGSVTPDHYVIAKGSYRIIKKQINKQVIQLTKVGAVTKQRTVGAGLQKRQKISDKKIIELAKLGRRIHQHYFFPQDIEWGIEKNKIYILQTRPVTALEQTKAKHCAEDIKKLGLPVLVEGHGASPGIVSGYSRIIKSAREINQVKLGEILVTKRTTPDFVPAMRRAGGIVTDQGGQTSHAAIVSRELGIACVVGTSTGTQKIKPGVVITIDGAEGKVYQGSIGTMSKNNQAVREKNSLKPSNLTTPLKTATKLYVNLADPQTSLEIGQKNVDGVGLLRAEFMISQQVKYHPKKLISDRRGQFFVSKLREGIKEICQNFNPRPVIYRATDFKTNEYRNLIGGKGYEPEEENPMLGFRGAFRYLANEEVFRLELAAIKEVREKDKFKNLRLMIPFVRSVNELEKVKDLVTSTGLTRYPSFELWMMIEVPSNIILLEDFIKVGIDGVSIGSNDLTMLVLGIDRDNEELASAFDERDKAVLWCLEKAIKTCLKHKIKCSICGQAPTLYPDLTEMLVKWGITSVSVSPDMIDQTREVIYQAEARRAFKG